MEPLQRREEEESLTKTTGEGKGGEGGGPEEIGLGKAVRWLETALIFAGFLLLVSAPEG